MNVAFVLLSQVKLPTVAQVTQRFAAIAAPGETIGAAASDGEDADEDQILSLQFGTGENAFVALMPAAVPDGEADGGVQFSLSSFSDEWTLPEHCAHLIVTLQTKKTVSAIEELHRFTSLLAAVAQASEAVGVYWGNAGATHDPDFFISIASDHEVASRIMVWTGVSVAREEDGRLSLLSLGMQQLSLPNLVLVASESSADAALETFFDLLTYVAERGEAMPDGDTVGRTEDERLKVRYVQSPVDPEETVWRVELP